MTVLIYRRAVRLMPSSEGTCVVVWGAGNVCSDDDKMEMFAHDWPEWKSELQHQGPLWFRLREQRCVQAWVSHSGLGGNGEENAPSPVSRDWNRNKRSASASRIAHWVGGNSRRAEALSASPHWPRFLTSIFGLRAHTLNPVNEIVCVHF